MGNYTAVAGICSIAFVCKRICASEEPLFTVVACCEFGFVNGQHQQHMCSLKLELYFAGSMLVVGDCQRCFATGTNTNNGGQWAPAGNTNSGEKEDEGVNLFMHLTMQ